ncbi:hypothetical protein LTR05_006077 [Lithohypha guttulata]|uniref:Alpha/beta hydrolase fold-3 domain-containing protein n=1 Tax=Lithohypha guttulata TaxID=1690604 RepID=A0AAN7SWN4_9EURO|nr:hypothetical protein LTR05_006077 [Lithohypha guttulata]
MPITTIGIGAAVTPTVVKTAFSHYTNRKPRAQKPTAHISYDEGLHLIRSFLLYASHHTVEEVQAFTGQWVPHPRWTRIEDVPIPAASIHKAGELLTAQLGEDGIHAIGGKKWWLWRRKEAELKGEWIEMRSDYTARQREKRSCRRIMMYIHGGGYFFGGVDEHRYQLQRHARKLQARVFAPRYRLAPQFPFPCGMLDCLAAYMYLLTTHDSSEIIFAGDSAGGGMALSLLCLLRDQNIPLPAGAILISPWVDLTHSFPSLSRNDGYDYIPAYGFHQKPSRSWPPPNEDELQELLKEATHTAEPTSDSDNIEKPLQHINTTEAARSARKMPPPIALQIDGQRVVLKDQVQLYTTNQLITHPLVSPVLQPSLGGLPPLFIMVGGGELLRDEQIYVAHKAANPQEYRLPEQYRQLHDPRDEILSKYKPTPVHLQVWDDLCHVTPTLSFTRPAKYMYRSIAQFGAWALSRAQKRAIEINEEQSSEDSSSEEDADPKAAFTNEKSTSNSPYASVGKAGDPLPPFKNNMIRQRVDRHGDVYLLPRASDLPALQMDPELVGVIKEGPIRTWLSAKAQWDSKYASTRRKVHNQRLNDVRAGRTRCIEGENPPPSALAGRLHDAETYSATQKLKKSWGLGVWSSWGWKHDERSMQKDDELGKEDKKHPKESLQEKGDISSTMVDGTSSTQHEKSRSRSRRRSSATRRKTVTVRDEGQTEADASSSQSPEATIVRDADSTTPTLTFDPAAFDSKTDTASSQHLSPSYVSKWKHSNHLKDESRSFSDAASTYTQASHMVADNASTRAVFSAAGVKRDLSAETPTPTQENKQFDFRSATPSGQRDNLGGYDTPQSRRSLERLKRHDTGLSDGQSVHSSMPASMLGVDGTTDARLQTFRNPSSMAVVQAEGVIEPIKSSVENEASPAAGTASLSSSEASTAQRDGTNIPAQNATVMGEPHIDGVKAPTTSQRPGLYERDASTFMTAREKL